MVEAWIDKNKLYVKTDDSSIKYLLEDTRRNNKYLPWAKKWGTITETTKFYDAKKEHGGYLYFQMGLGWISYIINVLRSSLSSDDYNSLVKSLISDNIRNIPFPELRDYQNEDVLHLLKYRIGLFSCYTSYGKTQVIATLANYFYNQGKSVLLITPGKKANDEIVKRCDKAFGIKVPSDDLRINNMITSGLLNRKDVKDPDKLTDLENLWGSYEVVLVDEVEYTMSDSGKFLYDRLTGANIMYGFSGTADKSNSDIISFASGITDVVIRNRDLISYFGPSLVYKLPLKLDIDIIKVKTSALSRIKFSGGDFDENSNVYNNVLNKIWTSPEVCEVIVKLVKKYPKLFIPINNLNTILNNWIYNYFLKIFRVLLICNEGYIYYDLNGEKTKLKDLQEAWNAVNENRVDVILGTSSSYRALDLPGLENILLIQGKVAGVVLQAVGRVARGNHMNVISLETITGNKVPIYSKMLAERDEMINTYYKYCNIKNFEIYEANL